MEMMERWVNLTNQIGRVFTNLRHNQFAPVLYQKDVSIEN